MSHPYRRLHHPLISILRGLLGLQLSTLLYLFGVSFLVPMMLAANILRSLCTILLLSTTKVLRFGAVLPSSCLLIPVIAFFLLQPTALLLFFLVLRTRLGPLASPIPIRLAQLGRGRSLPVLDLLRLPLVLLLSRIRLPRRLALLAGCFPLLLLLSIRPMPSLRLRFSILIGCVPSLLFAFSLFFTYLFCF